MAQRKNPNTSTKRKMSEMILEMGAGLVDVGETVDDSQNRLNATCTAWNIACASSVLFKIQRIESISVIIMFHICPPVLPLLDKDFGDIFSAFVFNYSSASYPRQELGDKFVLLEKKVHR